MCSMCSNYCSPSLCVLFVRHWHFNENNSQLSIDQQNTTTNDDAIHSFCFFLLHFAISFNRKDLKKVTKLESQIPYHDGVSAVPYNVQIDNIRNTSIVFHLTLGMLLYEIAYSHSTPFTFVRSFFV